MILCVGIDPSINSTGICLSQYNEITQEEQGIHFGIIHCEKLTKKEKKAQEEYEDLFKYYLFNGISKEDAKKMSQSDFEYAKTIKLRNCLEEIKKLLHHVIYEENIEYSKIIICIEGISYGSLHGTKSIFDLAGLNYMIRNTLIDMLGDKMKLIISPPSVVKKFATGKGNANKQEMIDSFKLIFPEFELPKIDDVCDAFFMKEIAAKEISEMLS